MFSSLRIVAKKKHVTHQEGPDTLYPVVRRGLVVGRRFDFGKTGLEVHVFRVDEPRTFPETRAGVENGVDDQGQVVRDEGVGSPVSFQEDRPATKLRKRVSRY